MRPVISLRQAAGERCALATTPLRARSKPWPEKPSPGERRVLFNHRAVELENVHAQYSYQRTPINANIVLTRMPPEFAILNTKDDIADFERLATVCYDQDGVRSTEAQERV